MPQSKREASPPYRVLIVDDSQFFQKRLSELIDEHPDLEVIGAASNGQEAITMEESLRPDIISMDYEMPRLDGLSAVRSILAKRSVPIIMFSSVTYEGARISLEAIGAGAVDFIPKDFAEISNQSDKLKEKLHQKLLAFAHYARPIRLGAEQNESEPMDFDSLNIDIPKLKENLKLVILGASTGGPSALTEIIPRLPANFPLPIVVIQHMPENFTKVLAQRLDKLSSMSVSEARTGDALQQGKVFVAPGGKHLLFDSESEQIKIIAGDDRLSHRPSIDMSFASAANAFADATLGVVLTGMGADGCKGAAILKQKNGTLWAQDKASSTVFGMPAAIVKAGLADSMLSTQQIIKALTHLI